METLCARCARLSLAGAHAARSRAQTSSRVMSTSRTLQENNDSRDTRVAQAGSSTAHSIKNESEEKSQTPRLLIRRTSSSQPNAGSSSAQRPLIRRSPSSGASQIPQRAPPQGAQVLRRNAPIPPGQVLRRTTGPPGKQTTDRSRAPNLTGTSRPGGRPAGGFQRQGQRPQQQGQSRPDRRRRKAPKQEEEEYDEAAVEKEMDDYIKNYVDLPANPTETLPYNPKQLTLKDLSSDWPNTPLTATGMTESVIQRIEWLARRLPHGYQSPEQIAEHYLKGKLTRFESEEEKQLVLKLASEMTAKTKLESDEGTLHKHETPRFQIVQDPSFTSVVGKGSDKGYLIDTGVKGDYGEVPKQRYPFLQNAARLLNNNETYGPAQTQRLLGRVQALIPQGKNAPTQQAKRG